jgi:hypothetical protein
LAAAHVSGAPVGYAWLVFGQDQRVNERLDLAAISAT